jgi:hypothetical protein
MNIEDIDRLLDPAPMALEMGYERLPTGVLHVACRTDLHRCRGAMFEWWFRSRPNTQQYIWWHPLDHISSEWLEGKEGTHIGSIHKVEERFGGGPSKQLLIQCREPAEFFSAAALDRAQTAGHVHGMVCGRGGESWQAPRNPAGQVMGSRLFHICRDTEWGTVLRSHFFLGCDLPAIGKTPGQIAELIPDPVGPALLGHCYNEFTFLSRFLPSLYIAENRDSPPVQLPW